MVSLRQALKDKTPGGSFPSCSYEKVFTRAAARKTLFFLPEASFTRTLGEHAGQLHTRTGGLSGVVWFGPGKPRSVVEEAVWILQRLFNNRLPCSI